MNFAKVFGGLLSLALSFSAFAQDVGFQNINREDFRRVVGDFSANSLHSSVSGAGTLGDIFGFEFGVVGGLTNTPEIDKLAKEVSSNNSAEQIPHAELLGVLSVPFALTVEAGFVPKVGKDDFKYNSMSLAVKWTPSQLFFDLPVDIALKLHTTKAELDFRQIQSGIDTRYHFENSLLGLTLLVSKDFVFAAPYVAVGTINAKGDLDANGAAVFDPTYSTSQSASEKRSGTMFTVGSEFKLFVVKLGLEYANLFETDRYTGKISFYF